MLARRSRSLVGFVLASQLLAHGGSYIPPPPPPPPVRPSGGGHYGGPGDVTPGGPSSPRTPGPAAPSSGGPSAPATGSGGSGAPTPSGPTTGAPAGPSAPAPSGPGGGPRGATTAGRGLVLEHDFDTWDYWWEFNKNRFLLLRDVDARGVQTGSDDWYLGATRRRDGADTLRPTAEHVVQVVLPALKRTIDASSSRDIATACMMAMAKIGADHPDFELASVFVPRLRSGDQEVRETAALALGVAGRGGGRAFALLEALALDAAAGREACGRAVDERTRAFATYGLGLTAFHATDVAVKRRVLDVLRRLGDAGSGGRNVRTAAIHGLGLLAPEVRTYAGLQLRDEALAVLAGWYGRELGAGDELIQAHCPTAIAKLLSPGEAVSERWCERFAAALARERGERRRGHTIAQSCALALGQLVANGSPAAVEHSETLLAVTRSHPDTLTRCFAMLAVAQIGGDDNRGALLQELDRADGTARLPWCVLALGVLEHGERARQVRAHRVAAADPAVVDALTRTLRDAKQPGLVGALGIALGLCDAIDAAPKLRERLLDGVAKEQMAGYLCIGLALLRDRAAGADVRRVFTTERRRPQLLVQAAVALGKLGDRDAAELMVARMLESEANLSQFAALATALSQVGDRRSIAPLVRLLQDDAAGSLNRAFAAAALGGICDWRELPWNTPIGANINYRATVETLTDQSMGILDIL